MWENTIEWLQSPISNGSLIVLLVVQAIFLSGKINALNARVRALLRNFVEHEDSEAETA